MPSSTGEDGPVIGIDEVEAAARRLDGSAVRTPVVRHADLDALVGGEVRLKAESLQLGGAFKFRGAFNRISCLDAEERRRGVITASSGNHAQAVALAAARCDTTAVVLMPHDAPAVKRAATERFGAEVVEFDRYAVDREELLTEHAAASGRVVVHPDDDELVMAGQGTCALELLEQSGPLDDLICPVGGGGLISGCSTVVDARLPGARTWGVEPEAGDDTRRSLQAGARVTIDVPRTIADGQQLTTPGERPFAVISARVHDVVTVSDEEIVTAMRFAYDRLKLVVEPSGACALAAVLAGRVPSIGSRVGVIVSGGNVDLDRFASLLS